MNAAPPKPTVLSPRRAESWRVRTEQRTWADRARMWGAAAVALGLHAIIFVSSKEVDFSPAEVLLDDGPPTMEVDLVESGEEAATTDPVAPEPEPVPEPEMVVPEPQPPEPEPTPEPEPEPEPQPELEEMVAPTPKPKPAPTPRPAPPKPRVATQRPSAVAPAVRIAGSNAGSPEAGGSGRGGRNSGIKAIYQPDPPFPPQSQAAGEYGEVTLRVSVDANGRPTDITVAKSSGYSRLDQAAREGARRWRFKAAVKNGVPISGVVLVPVKYTPRR